MSLVTLLNALASIAFGAAMVLVARVPATRLSLAARRLALLFLAVYVCVTAFNVLEHAGLTSALDPVEEYFEIVFIALFSFFVSTVTSQRELDKRARAEETLRESESTLRTLFEHMTQGVVYVNADGVVTAANRAAESILGRAVVGFDVVDPQDEWFRVVREDGSPLALADFPLVVALRTGNEVRNEVIGILRDDENTIRWVSVHAVPEIGEGSDEPIRVLATFDDITDRRLAEGELFKREKLESLSLLAGGLAHDFNNLLTAILGNVNLAKLTVDDPTAATERLVEAERACLRARELTKQLLAFSTESKPIKKTANVGDLVRESTNFGLRGSNVQPGFSIPTDLWPAELDEGQIGQVINNLVINAAQAMPEGGRVSITCENVSIEPEAASNVRPGDYVRIVVQDHGAGILEENRGRIFDPYFTTKKNGTGLGLSTAYSVLRKHEGYIAVESVVGEGSTFTVLLPAAKEMSVMVESTKERPMSGKGRILLLDDEEMILDVAGRMLERLGYDVTCVRDGHEAIDRFAESRSEGTAFDAVIMDLTIPGGMGGEEAIKQLRERYPDIKALVSSGYSSAPIMSSYREYGFDAVISKPYRLSELSEALDHLLSGQE